MTELVAGTVYARCENRFWLARLGGMLLGKNGEESDQGFAQGVALLKVDGRPYEAGQLVLDKVEELPAAVRCEWKVGQTGLRLTTAWLGDPATGVVSRRDALCNTSEKPVTVSRCLARFALPSVHYECYTQASSWCRENQGGWQRLHSGLRLSHISGRTTEGFTPYLGLRSLDGAPGMACHILPCGNWTIRVNPNVPYTVVELGLADENLNRVLNPGESLALPEILFQALPGGEAHLAAPALHRYLVDGRLRTAKPQAPVVYNSWFDQHEVLEVPRLRRQLAAAKEAGCEVFVVDAGWYGAGEGGWGEQTGDWREKQSGAFFGRMGEFADEVRAAGLGFGLWMEPEKYGPKAPIRVEHPEWFVANGDAARLDLTQPAARAWLRGEIGRLVETYRLAWMKVDFNFRLDADASGAELAAYTAAWYGLLDEIRAAYPATFFEGCSSGAMRGDLETLCHFDGHFLSDTSNPTDTLRILQGAWLRLPPGRITIWCVLRSASHVVPGWGTSVDNAPPMILVPCGAGWWDLERSDLDLALVDGMPTMMGLGGDLAGLTPEQLKRVTEAVAFYKPWRSFIARAEAHLLTPPAPIEQRDGWVGVQLRSPGADASLVFVYRLGNASAAPALCPVGLDAGTHYSVEIGFGAERKTVSVDGASLVRDGLSAPEFGVVHRRASVFVIRPELGV
jgi:alpha-galactosidase